MFPLAKSETIWAPKKLSSVINYKLLENGNLWIHISMNHVNKEEKEGICLEENEQMMTKNMEGVVEEENHYFVTISVKVEPEKKCQ